MQLDTKDFKMKLDFFNQKILKITQLWNYGANT